MDVCIQCHSYKAAEGMSKSHRCQCLIKKKHPQIYLTIQNSAPESQQRLHTAILCVTEVVVCRKCVAVIHYCIKLSHGGLIRIGNVPDEQFQSTKSLTELKRHWAMCKLAVEFVTSNFDFYHIIKDISGFKSFIMLGPTSPFQNSSGSGMLWITLTFNGWAMDVMHALDQT